MPDEAPAQFECETCGLSDLGYERLRSLGFNVHPCRHCREHFEGRDD